MNDHLNQLELFSEVNSSSAVAVTHHTPLNQASAMNHPSFNMSGTTTSQPPMPSNETYFLSNENVKNQHTFDELMALLSNCTISNQMSLDDKIEISLLQLQLLEIKNFGVEQSTKLKQKFKDDLIKREQRWCKLNSQIDKMTKMTVGLKCDVDRFKVKLQIAFEKKMAYLNFLLQSAKKSMNQDSLRNFLSKCNDDQPPYSIVACGHHFELNANCVDYDLDGLARLAARVESELKQLGLTNIVPGEDAFCANEGVGVLAAASTMSGESSLTSTNQLTAAVSTNRLVLNLPTADEQDEEKQTERYAAKQLNKVMSNIANIKSLRSKEDPISSEEHESSSNERKAVYRNLFNQALNIEQYHITNDAHKNDSTSTDRPTGNTYGTGLDEFTDELPDTFFAEIPCSQLAADHAHLITEDNDVQATSQICSDYNSSDDSEPKLIIDDCELDLSIDSENSRAALLNQPHQLSTHFVNTAKQPDRLSFDLPCYCQSSLDAANYRIELSSSSDRFFATGESSESVVKKTKHLPKKSVFDKSIDIDATNEDELEETNTAEFNLKTLSLSSQISFN